MGGDSRIATRGGRSEGRNRATAGGRGRWNWIRRRAGSAKLRNGFEQLAPVAYYRHADVLEIIGRQLQQHSPIDFVLTERSLVSLEAQAVQPCRHVHQTLPVFYSMLTIILLQPQGKNPIHLATPG